MVSGGLFPKAHVRPLLLVVLPTSLLPALLVLLLPMSLLVPVPLLLQLPMSLLVPVPLLLHMSLLVLLSHLPQLPPVSLLLLLLRVAPRDRVGIGGPSPIRCRYIHYLAVTFARHRRPYIYKL
jgi:hypothetical protein